MRHRLLLLTMIIGLVLLPTLLAHSSTTLAASGQGIKERPVVLAQTSGIQVQIKANGPDSNQQTQFAYSLRNTGATAVSGLSVRVYFTLDGSNAASNYTLEKYYDQSGVATVSGPTLASGTTYYFTVSYGTTSLAANGQWEYHTSIHLSNWATTFSGTNDWFHTGYAAGALPAAYTNHNNLPAFVSGTLNWGQIPGGSTPTFQPPSNTPTTGPSPTPSSTPTRTNTPSNTPTGGTPVGGVTVQIKANGSDNNQQTGFAYLIRNTGTSAVTGLSVRVYFTLDGSNAASLYVLEKYYDQSGVATVSTPTQASGSIYYITVNYGTASLPANGQWEFQTALHLSNWNTTFSGANDWFHTGFAAGSLPAPYTNHVYLPAFVGTSLVWGQIPTGGTPIPSNTPSNTPTTGPSPTPTNTTPPTNTPTPSLTPSIGPSLTPTNTNTATRTPTPSNTPLPGTHLANPFVGAVWYVNPEWSASVTAAAGRQTGALAATMLRVATKPTFVWLDSIDAVNGTNGYPRSLAGHLDAAVAQGANLIGIVIYDLPNRDCSALASNGELLIAQNGFNRYKTEYIDVIANTFASKPAYANLRIVAVIEPDSLPNLVTNLSFTKCQEANGPGGYREATQYTLNKLHPFSNFYAYIDIGHAGWLGWDPSNFTPAVNLIADTILGTTAGGNSVDGFISNTANTSVVTEPFMTANQMISGQPVRSANFFQWNTHIDEGTFDAAWKAAMAAKGIRNGMLVDTSRNGWGGCGGGPNVSQPCRPTGPSTSTDLNTFVNQSRTDRRPAKGDWCNQNGAGIGAVPQANPPDAGGTFQAFVWVKPPGESDGSSSLIPPGPDNPGGKGFDPMCDPNYPGNPLNNNSPTNALPNAPVSGRWFEAQFIQLVQNANPPIP